MFACVPLTFKDMDIDEVQDAVEEEIFEQEAKKVAVQFQDQGTQFPISFKVSVVVFKNNSCVQTF